MSMRYAENYERVSIGEPNVLQRWFIRLLTRKAAALGQKSHKMWTLKYLLDTYLAGRTGLRVLDCGTWNGWFLSYDTPAIAHKVGLVMDGAEVRFHAKSFHFDCALDDIARHRTDLT